LLANAVCQSCMYQLTHRIREQARSHIWTVVFQGYRGEAIAAWVSTHLELLMPIEYISVAAVGAYMGSALTAAHF